MATLQATAVTGNLSCTTLTGGTLAAAVGMPPGYLVQIRHMVSDTGYSIANDTTFNDMPAWDLSLTPTLASNSIHYTLCSSIECRYDSPGGGSGGTLRVTHNAPGSYTEFANMVFSVHWNQLDNQKTGSAVSKTGILATGNTNACNFRPQYEEQHGNTEAWFGNSITATNCVGTRAIAMEYVPS